MRAGRVVRSKNRFLFAQINIFFSTKCNFGEEHMGWKGEKEEIKADLEPLTRSRRAPYAVCDLALIYAALGRLHCSLFNMT